MAPIGDFAQLRVPPGWKVTSTARESATLVAPNNKIGISPGSAIAVGGALGGPGDVKANVAELADSQHKRLVRDGDKKITRMPDETINGALFYHFRYETDTEWNDMYGTVTSDIGHQISIEWHVMKSTSSRADEDAMVKQIMPTFKLL